MAEENKMNIYQRMSAATSEISRVAKNLNVGFGKSSYKAVGEADVLAAVKPIEEKYGIYSYPVSREIIESGILESVSEYNGEKTTKKQFQMRVSTVYRFVNVDKPEEYIDITTYGDGVDSQDKAPGKAMTYADKYALLKAYKIMTGDDPDQNASSETKGYSRKQVDAPKEPELISDKDKEILRKTVEDKGYTVEQIFPKGIDGLTAEQYAKAMTQLKGMKPKNG
jgi:hypothetical protein